jgi:hypothetical protein
VSLRLQVERLAEPRVVPRATVTKLYVSEGRARGKAAIIGAAIGFAVAGALAVAAGTSCSGECLCSGSGCMVLVPILGIPAAATGAGVGALVAPERWREIPVDGAGPGAAYGFSSAAGSNHLRLGLAPIRGGAAVSVACSF